MTALILGLQSGDTLGVLAYGALIGAIIALAHTAVKRINYRRRYKNNSWFK